MKILDQEKIYIKAGEGGNGSPSYRREKLIEIKWINCNIPQGAFYLFPDVSYYFGKSDGKTTINSSDDLCMYLLNTCYVSLVAGTPFGNPECVRISYAASEESLLEAIRRIKNQLSELKWPLMS